MSQLRTQPVFPDASPFHALVNQTDWTGSPLGDPLCWPLSLRANMNLILDARVPMSIVWGPQRALLYNAAYTQFLGAKHPWALGRSIDTVWPEIWSEIGPLVDRARAGESFHLEDLALPIERNGRVEPAWFTFFYSPVRGDDGALSGMCSTVVETTSRVNAEAGIRELNKTLETRVAARTEELERSDAYLRLATDAARLGIWTWDAVGGRMVWENARMLELVGPSPGSEAVDMARFLAGISHPEDAASCQAAVARTFGTGEPFHYEGRFYRASDGSPCWLEFTGLLHRDAGGRLLRMAGTAADVTERNVVLERLRTREERYRTLLTSMDEAFCIVELLFDENGTAVDHRFLETNPAFETHTGLVDVVGKTARELALDIEQRWNELYAGVARSGEPVRVVQHAKSLGRWFDVFVSRAQPDAQDRVAIVFRNITEQRRIDAELHQLAADLARANRRQNEFLATLAHELRNPLAPIRTGLDLMRLKPGDEAAAARIRGMMQRQVDHLVHLVNDLLDLARIQSGKIELKRVCVALGDIVANAVETALPGIEARRHRLIRQLPDQPILLDADPDRLVQVIGNLLANAAKYTRENGSITLAVRREGDMAVLSVTDNGVGIPAANLPHLFEMFRQGCNGAHLAQDGLGIGLHLVKRLTEMHGGTVTAASDGPDQGSTFTLRLPVAGAMRAPAAPGALEAGLAPGLQALRILVVDDNRDAAESLAALLQLDGHVVQAWHDGAAALAAAPGFLPDLALLDIGMPGMDGYALARALRHTEALKETVLVALTGWGAQEDRERARDAGFDHHLTKPVGLDSLRGLLRKVARPDA